MKRFSLVLLLGAFVIGTFAVFYYSPTRVVKRKVEKICSLASVDSSDGLPIRGLTAQRLESLLAETVTVSSNLSVLDTTFSRDELVSGFAGFLNYVKTSRVEPTSITVELTGEEEARARITLDAEIEFQNNRRSYAITGYMDFIKADGSWVLRHALVEDTGDEDLRYEGSLR